MRLLLSTPARDEVVHQLHGGVVHLDVEGFDFVGEIIVEPHGRYGDEQAESGGDEGFSDAAGDGRKAAGMLRRDALERADDAHDRAEESDERSRGADGGEAGEPALHFGVNDGDGALKAALGRFYDFGIRHLSRGGLELGESSGHDFGNVALLVALGDGDGFVQLVVLQGSRDLLNEHARLLTSSAVHERAVNHDTNRPGGHDEQNDDYNLRGDVHGVPHAADIPAHFAAAFLQQQQARPQ